MTITVAQANLLLANSANLTPDGLLAIVGQLSVTTPADRPGAITLLYSGTTGPNRTGPSTTGLAEYIATNQPDSVRVINSTPAAEFLTSIAFEDALKVAIPNDIQRGNWLYDATRGPWAVVSDNFVGAATGPISSVTPFADPSRTFGAVEMARALATPGVPTIEGVPREQLVALRDSLTSNGLSSQEALRITAELASFGSRATSQTMAVATEMIGGKETITWADLSRYTGAPSGPAPSQATLTTLGDLAGNPSPEYMTGLSRLATSIEEARINVKYFGYVGVAGNILGTVGGLMMGVSFVSMAYEANNAYTNGDTAGALTLVRDWSLGSTGAALLGGMAFSGTASLLAPLALLGPIGIGGALIGVIGTSLLAAHWGHQGGIAFGEAISNSVNSLFGSALNWVPPRRDPLVLDLDGGGITTSGINPNAPILFDQDGDGTLTATGWIASGEAIVVRDLNGNGTVDSGRELFGDNTILTHGARAGQTAANGFEALADLDSNGDGKFDANDADFASVKLWKDLNQDGVSQAAELFSFADLGVDSINVSGTASNVNLGGGNTQTFAGSFTRTTGATGDAGTAELAGSLLLANNNFYREFTDDPALTAEAQALPQMTGSGLVRDLRPAMSLGTVQATALQNALTQFAADSTRSEQRADLDTLVQSWGATSAMQTSIQTNTTLANSAAGAGSITAIQQFAQNNPDMYAKITALEQFNGQVNAIKRVAACACSARAISRFGYKTIAMPQYGRVSYSLPIVSPQTTAKLLRACAVRVNISHSSRRKKWTKNISRFSILTGVTA